MGKKRAAVIGSPEEDQVKAEKDTKREQKKLREGKATKAPSSKVSQSVAETPAGPLVEPEKIQTKETLSSSTSLEQTTSKTPKKSRIRSKTYLSSKSQINVDKTYSLSDGLLLLRKVSSTKFDSTVELHLILRTAPTSKLSVSLPHAFGKSRRVVVATDEVIAQIQAGKTEFDLLVASPTQMAKLVKFAKVLGPKGLMPNPKTGTVSDKPEETAKKLSSDTTTFLKLDKSGPVIHTSVGKLSFKDKDLQDNISAVLASVSGNLKKAILKSTMSPAIKLHV